jgi:predicted DNA-binding transcriptional regulator AlpA
MGRKVDVDDLVGATEIAKRLDVARQVVHLWRTRDATFPEPLTTVTRTMVWNWPDVEAWARATKRL